MPSFQKLVILFTRYPQVGKCKSRLIPALGADGALHIHRQLVSHILSELKKFLALRNNTSLHIYHNGGTLQEMQQWLGSEHLYREQYGNTLGERMANAINRGLEQQQDTILIGSDCPAITPDILNSAMDALTHNDAVIGPAYDGGYYLVGVAGNMQKNTCGQLFENIPWGTKEVLQKTLERVHTLGLNIDLLDKLHDIDRKEDLKYFHYCPDPK